MRMNNNENGKTAIFYPIEELGHYQVEIQQHEDSYFISEKGKPLTFMNIADAKLAAISHKAAKGLLALKSSSEEFIDANPKKETPPSYDFISIPLVVD